MQVGRWLPSFVFTWALFSSHAHAEPLGETAGALSVCRAGTSRVIAKAERARGDAALIEAAVRPNPSLIVEHQRTLSGAADRETVLGLSVPIGISGRRGLLQDAAEARRRQSYAEAHATLFEGIFGTPFRTLPTPRQRFARTSLGRRNRYLAADF